MYRIWIKNENHIMCDTSDTLPPNAKCVVNYGDKWYISDNTTLTETTTETVVGIPTVIYTL